MTVLSAQSIQRYDLIRPCNPPWKDTLGNSCGLSACGYDITLAEDVMLYPGSWCLASAKEYFSLSNSIVGIIHDKSSLARMGLAVQNTVAEPGWRGYLTLELSNHSAARLKLPAGSAIAQVIFHVLDEPTFRPYKGKYQDQEAGPQDAR